LPSEAIRASAVDSWRWLDMEGAVAHNVVVSTAVELGPIGLGLLGLLLLPMIARRGWGPDAGAVQAGLASLMAMALFLDIVTNRKQVWLMIGLAGGLLLLRARERARAREAEPSAEPSVEPQPPEVSAVAEAPPSG
jgi:hypothetical protein